MNHDDASNQVVPDRRIQKTQQALIEGLLELLSVKHYDSISIRDITEKANVGRSTFYAHFESKDDLLKHGFEGALDSLLQHVIISEENQKLTLDVTALFAHAKIHYELYRTLSWGSGFDLITMQGHALLSKKLLEKMSSLFSDKPDNLVPLTILCHSLAGGILVLLKWWLDNEMPYPPERMNGIFQQLILPGFQLSLSPSSP